MFKSIEILEIFYLRSLISSDVCGSCSNKCSRYSSELVENHNSIRIKLIILKMKIFKLLFLSSSLPTISLSLIFDHLSVSLIFSACVAKSCIVTTCNTCVLIFIYQLCWPLANTLEHVSNKYFMSAILQMNEDILYIPHD